MGDGSRGNGYATGYQRGGPASYRADRTEIERGEGVSGGGALAPQLAHFARRRCAKAGKQRPESGDLEAESHAQKVRWQKAHQAGGSGRRVGAVLVGGGGWLEAEGGHGGEQVGFAADHVDADAVEDGQGHAQVAGRFGAGYRER